MSPPLTLELRPLREVWDGIKPCLEEMKQTWPELGNWRVEDVYAAVKHGEAVIYTTEDGFAVCTYEVDEYSQEKDLFIWIAYAYDQKRGGILKKYLPSFIEVAKSLGCAGVSTASNHAALTNIPELKPVYTQYRVRIDEET